MGMNIKKFKIILPGAITSISILCGLFAIFFSIMGHDNAGTYTASCWLIIFAAIIDGVDGKVARLTNSSSDFGIQYDSIADIITFGTATSVVLFKQIFADLVEFSPAYYLLPIIYLLCGSIRLARFNTTATTGAKKCFYGLPIPSAAGTLMSLLLFFHALETIYGVPLSDALKTRVTVFYTLLVSVLMVSLVEHDITSRFFFGEIRKHWLRSIINFLIALYLIVGYILFDDAGTACFLVAAFYIFYSLGLAFRRFIDSGDDSDSEVQLQQE
jgi:CDP-diacylglycerol---serine O-phosphatidyltransferase